MKKLKSISMMIYMKLNALKLQNMIHIIMDTIVALVGKLQTGAKKFKIRI